MVVQRFPTVRNWTATLLRERGQLEFKNGGVIGRGSIESIIDPVSIEALYVNNDSIIVTAPVPSTTENTLPPNDEAPVKTLPTTEAPSTNEAPGNTLPTTEEASSNDEIKSSIREATASIKKMMNCIKNAPATSKDINCFKVVAVTALRMVGVEVARVEQDVSNPIDNMTHAMEVDQEDNPEWIDLIEKMMEIYDEKSKLVAEGTSIFPDINLEKKDVS